MDQNSEQEQLSPPEEKLPRGQHFRSFLDLYGTDDPSLTRTDRIKQYLKKQFATLSFLCCLNAILEKFPILRCLKEYNIRKYLFGDIISGITVAIMHIPQGKKLLIYVNVILIS